MRNLVWMAFVVGSVGMGLGHSSPAFADTAAEMAGYCEAYRTAVVDAPEHVSVKATATSDYCWGAFAALQDLGRMVVTRDPKTARQSALRLCLPPESTRLELVKVFIRYMDEHPNLGHVSFAEAVLPAMRQAFPCKG